MIKNIEYKGAGAIYQYNQTEEDYECCNEQEYVIQVGNDILGLSYYEVDQYRSSAGISVLKEMPKNLILLKNYKHIEVFSIEDELGDDDFSQYVEADGIIIADISTIHYDQWYYSGHLNVDLNGIKIDFSESMNKQQVFEYEFPKAFSFIVTGEPRTGKTTTINKFFKKNIVDTDGFENPLYVVDSIKEDTAYIIGKYRDVVINTPIGSFSYAGFIDALLSKKGIDVFQVVFQTNTLENIDNELEIQIKMSNYSPMDKENIQTISTYFTLGNGISIVDNFDYSSNFIGVAIF